MSIFKLKITSENGTPVSLYLGMSNFAVYESKDNRTGKTVTIVNDGVHNNGGWKVQESLEEVTRRIEDALKFGK